MSDRLENRVAVITGAASGIGRAIAGELASRGAAVAIADVNIDAGKRAAEEIAELGGRVEAFAVDVTAEEFLRLIASGCWAVLRRFGKGRKQRSSYRTVLGGWLAGCGRRRAGPLLRN